MKRIIITSESHGVFLGPDRIWSKVNGGYKPHPNHRPPTFASMGAMLAEIQAKEGLFPKDLHPVSLPDGDEPLATMEECVVAGQEPWETAEVLIADARQPNAELYIGIVQGLAGRKFTPVESNIPHWSEAVEVLSSMYLPRMEAFFNENQGMVEFRIMRQPADGQLIPPDAAIEDTLRWQDVQREVLRVMVKAMHLPFSAVADIPRDQMSLVLRFYNERIDFLEKALRDAGLPGSADAHKHALGVQEWKPTTAKKDRTEPQASPAVHVGAGEASRESKEDTLADFEALTTRPFVSIEELVKSELMRAELKRCTLEAPRFRLGDHGTLNITFLDDLDLPGNFSREDASDLTAWLDRLIDLGHVVSSLMEAGGVIDSPFDERLVVKGSTILSDFDSYVTAVRLPTLAQLFRHLAGIEPHPFTPLEGIQIKSKYSEDP